MTVKVFDRGAALTLDAGFQVYAPHVTTPTYTDPTSATISIVGPSGSYGVTNAVMSKTNVGSAGLFHYTLQTSTNWDKGIYQATVRGVYGYTDVTVFEHVFELE